MSNRYDPNGDFLAASAGKFLAVDPLWLAQAKAADIRRQLSLGADGPPAARRTAPPPWVIPPAAPAAPASAPRPTPPAARAPVAPPTLTPRPVAQKEPMPPKPKPSPDPFVNYAASLLVSEARTLDRQLTKREEDDVLAYARATFDGLPAPTRLPSAQAKIDDIRQKLGLGRREYGIVHGAHSIAIGAPLPRKGR